MNSIIPFHGYVDLHELLGTGRFDPSDVPVTHTTRLTGVERSLTYDFELHEHPFVSEMVQRLASGSISALQDADTDPTLQSQAFFGAYAPTALVEQTPPVRTFDFKSSAAYVGYHLEVFFF